MKAYGRCIVLAGWVLVVSGCAPSPQPAPTQDVSRVEPSEFTLEIVASPGGTIAPAPGKHTFKKDEVVRLSATPDRDYVFDYWDGPLSAVADPYAPATEFPMEENLKVGAQWLHRPGMGDIDFPEDLAFFLQSNQETTPVEQFDLNGEAPASRAPEASSGKRIGNGMPDVAELYLLQVVLQSGRLGLTPYSGVASTYAWEVWDKNIKQAATDLPNQDTHIQRVVAGYMTLGDEDSKSLIRELVAWHYGITLAGRYDHELRRWMAFDEDADNDGETNLEEWRAVSPVGALTKLPEFAAVALRRK